MESEPIIRILAEIEAERRQLTSLLASLSLRQLTRSAGGWSATETVLHIAAWQARASMIAEQQAAAEAPALDPGVGPGSLLGLDTAAVNQALLTDHAGWSLAQALQWYSGINATLQQRLARLPATRLLGGPGPHGACLWYARPAIVHSREHRLELAQRLGHA